MVLQASVGNTPPPAPAAVAIVARRARGGRGGRLRGAQPPQRDADQEPITLRYRWYRERPARSAIGEGERDARRRASCAAARSWRCEAWATDGTAESARVGAELAVRNTPPTAPAVDHRARACRAAATPSPAASRPPRNDRDGDAVTYAYAWTENDRPVAPGADPARVDPSRVAKGERWRCTATPTDGSAAGPATSAERGDGEHARRERRSSGVEPSAPRQGEPFRCEIVAKSEDPDGDSVRYRSTWQRNGAAQPFAESARRRSRRGS